MDKALQQQTGCEEEPADPPRRERADGAQDEKQQAVEQWLQRVPDDPGGLLRRKFLLEYQRRQQGPRAGDDSQ